MIASCSLSSTNTRPFAPAVAVEGCCHRVTRFAGATAVGALVVAAGFIGTDPLHPAVKSSTVFQSWAMG